MVWLGASIAACTDRPPVDGDSKADDDDQDNNGDDDDDDDDDSNGESSDQEDGDSSGEDQDDAGPTWTTRFPRLTHLQWENTIQDLFYFDAPTGLSAAFAPDESAHFDTNVGQKKVGSAQWEEYQRAAESVAQQVARDPKRLAMLVPKDAPEDPIERAQVLITTFGRRAFRRPLEADEVTRYLEFFQQGSDILGGDVFASGSESVIQAILQSPRFLYRIELSQAKQENVAQLSDYELATRLSYALLDTTPSDALLDAAQAGELADEAGLKKWAKKLKSDPRAAAKVSRFHHQLFRVADYATTWKDEKAFPDFDEALVAMLGEEAELFVNEILHGEEGGIAALLTSNITYVNERTAPLYGVPAPNGSGWQRVELDRKQRAGLLTQLGFLARNAGLFQSDPIHRGVGINLHLLCKELSPPPNTPPLPEIKPGQTNRQRIEEHTKDCGGACHNSLINPIGFAFENYDAVGQWRLKDNGKAVDAKASYELDDELVHFDGAIELLQALAQSDDLHRCYAQNWLEFAMGYVPGAGERQAITSLAKQSVGGSSANELLHTLIATPNFRTRADQE